VVPQAGAKGAPMRQNRDRKIEIKKGVKMQ
jgi:hypothetical protein